MPNLVASTLYGMKKNQIILFAMASVFMASAHAAQNALYSFRIFNTDTFTVEGSPRFSIYGLSERMKPIVQESSGRKVHSAEYSGGPLLRTSDPKMASQEVVNQISTQSGIELKSFYDSVFASRIAPSVVRMAISKKTVWNIILTPQEDGLYLLGVTCLVDE